MLSLTSELAPPTPRRADGATESEISSLGLWFDLDVEPRFAIDREGRLLAANPSGRRWLADGCVGVRPTGRLHFGDGPSDDALHCGLLADLSEAPCRLIIRLRDGAWRPADLSVGINGDCFVLAFRRASTAPCGAAMEAVAQAFHLTRVEAAVLSDLCAGECPKSLARQRDMSEHTVRAHLRSIYAKMGTRGLTNTVSMAIALTV